MVVASVVAYRGKKATLRAVESDIPKVIPGEIGRFFATPGFPPIGVEDLRLVGSIAQFNVVNRGPLPLLVSVGVRFPTPAGEIWSDKAVEFIGPLGKDEWQVDVPAGATTVDVRVGLFPAEVAVARGILEIP